MNLWLSRQANGLYMLTHFKPILSKVLGRETEDLYIVPGEPVGERNHCDIILKLFNIAPLKRLESIQVYLSGSKIEETK